MIDSLQKYLLEAGADVVGYADLAPIASGRRSHLPFGISVGIALDRDIVQKIPSNTVINEYADEYDRLNERLDKLSLLTSEYITERGYHAVPQTIGYVREHDSERSRLPHKTVAALSGLGWIAKSSLLITPQYGSALRLTSVLTDMPLKTSYSEYHCKCGDCTECVDACPGRAIKNKVWNLLTDRDELIDFSACRNMMLSRGERYGREYGTCGICIAVCSYTKKHLT